MNDTLHFLGISGSLRRQSRNTGLLRCAARSLPEGVSMDIADISDLPLYNEDMEKPASAARLIDQIRRADALVLACPEYNYSWAPALKNALDWPSREPGNKVLAGKPVAILGAGGGMGTSRSQYHVRQSCVCFDLRPLNKPEFFSNAFSASFDQDGNLVDDQLIAQVAAMMRALADWTRLVSGK